MMKIPRLSLRTRRAVGSGDKIGSPPRVPPVGGTQAGGGVTLCIPTLDRPEFLRRLLRYYADARYPHWLFIGDSSAPAHARRNQQTVSSFAGTLNIEYRQYPELSSCACLEQLSRMVLTPYAAFLGDDDFLCVGGINRCVEFLASHPEYVAAHGTALIFQIEGARPYGVFGTVTRYPQAVLETDTGSERLQELFRSGAGALLYAVHRTDTWQAMFRGLSRLDGIKNRNAFKDEIIATCVSVVRGKVRGLECLYLVRQVHSEDSYRFPHIYDQMTDPTWSSSYQIFQDQIVEELVRQDGLERERARAVVRETFWPFLAAQISEAWKHPPSASPRRRPSRLRTFAKRIPGIRRGWREVRARLQRSCDARSLPALLQTTSPFHADFMPIYQLITSPELEPADDSYDQTHSVNAVTVSSSAND